MLSYLLSEENSVNNFYINACEQKMFLIQHIIWTIFLYNMMKSNGKARSSTFSLHDRTCGPIKIKDGLFLGDELAARDMDFIISNKVTHIINTVVKKIPNLWEKYGISYLSVNWLDNEQNIFDKKSNSLSVIFEFIEEAMQQGQSCLIHSASGKSKASTVVVAYLMKKYCWALEKCLEFVYSRKDKFTIRDNFLAQLRGLERQLTQIYNLSTSWYCSNDPQDLLLTNTYKNASLSFSQTLDKKPENEKKSKKRVNWHDKISTPYRSNYSSLHVNDGNQISNKPIKSILKGFPSEEIPEEPKNQQRRLNRSQLISNKVEVSVNNYFSDSKQNKTISFDKYRPQSSDVKRQKKVEPKVTTKLFPYQNVISSFKSPYDSIFMSKVSSINKGKRKEQKPSLFTPNDRPSSTQDRRKAKGYADIINKNRQEMANFATRRYPTPSRDNIFKYK